MVIIITLIMILSMLVPTYSLEEEKLRRPKVSDKSDPILLAIRRIKS